MGTPIESPPGGWGYAKRPGRNHGILGEGHLDALSTDNINEPPFHLSGPAWAKVRFSINRLHEVLALRPDVRIERIRVTEDPDALWVYVSAEGIDSTHPDSEAEIISHASVAYALPEGRCRATNTEGALCVRERGHMGLHRPIEGREWETR